MVIQFQLIIQLHRGFPFLPVHDSFHFCYQPFALVGNLSIVLL